MSDSNELHSDQEYQCMKRMMELYRKDSNLIMEFMDIITRARLLMVPAQWLKLALCLDRWVVCHPTSDTFITREDVTSPTEIFSSDLTKAHQFNTFSGALDTCKYYNGLSTSTDPEDAQTYTSMAQTLSESEVTKSIFSRLTDGTLIPVQIRTLISKYVRK